LPYTFCKNEFKLNTSGYNNAFLDDFFEKQVVCVKESAEIVENCECTYETSSIECVSDYSPMCILNLSAEQILKMVEDDRVTEMGLFENNEVISLAENGADSVQGSYVRDVNGHKGSGAIVGICEGGGFPDLLYDELDNAYITLNDELLSIVDDHATKVATIICGEELGLAPDCQVYATYATNAVEFIEQMEWLITQGVHVINVSMGVPYGRFGTYTLIDKWSDHIDMNHNVLVVSATGNLFPNFKQVCSPAMSFNGIAV